MRMRRPCRQPRIPSAMPAIITWIALAIGVHLGFFASATARATAQTRRTTDTEGIAEPPAFAKPYSVPITGEINGWNFTTFKRRCESALERGADLLLVPIDTPGGELGAAFNFGDYIFTSLRPRARVVFYITNQALSAGALISLAGHEIVMGPGGTIGDCQPIFMGAGGITEGPEKIQSPIRAVFRKYADANGYPRALAESMVSPDIEVLRVEREDGAVSYVRRSDFDGWSEDEQAAVKSQRVAVKKGELLTMTATEAHRFGFAKAIVESDEQLGQHLGVPSFAPAKIVPTWSENMVRSVQGYNVLLVLIGLVCLYLEFKTPGFGFFGIAGAAAFLVYFAIGHLNGLSEYWEIAITIVGLLLIAVEIFIIPGFGIPGVLGIGCVLVGLFAGGLPGGVSEIVPTMPWQKAAFDSLLWRFAAAIGGAMVIAVVISRFLPDLPVLNRLVLVPQQDGPHAEAVPAATDDVGVAVEENGIAHTPLRPAGTARFGGRRLDVVTRGEFIDAGTPVRIVKIDGRRILVAATSEGTA